MAKTSKRGENEETVKKRGKTDDSQTEADTGKTVLTQDDTDSTFDPDAAAEAAAGSDTDPIAALQSEINAERDKYLRLAAEYDNYRKRSVRERELIYGDARADALTRLLPVYDNLERALKVECADEAFYRGVGMTMTQLTEILENMGVKPIPSVGEQFDPNLHNAVTTIENPELGKMVVAEEYQKGFMLGDRVLRHSTVVVAN